MCTRAVPNCVAYSEGGCESCTEGYFVNGAGECEAVSLLCNGYDTKTGFCLECIEPYTLDPSTGWCLYYP